MAILLAVVGPLIGLVGTLIGIRFGRRQAEREANERRETRETEANAEKQRYYKDKQHAAYKGLWETVETAQLLMRSSLDNLHPGRLAGHMSEVNTFMMVNGPFIDRSDGARAIEYLYLSYQFLFVVGKHPVTREWILTTSALPDDLPADLEMLQRAEHAALEAREDLLRSVIDKLGGQPEPDEFRDMMRRSIDGEFQSLVFGNRDEFRPLWSSGE